ncbi:carbon starvation CstA family protein, partial [Megasphaera sp.]|uniref:carbon starvation CstA family protein n=1 Tax=Megasphaera sp. TaxID=2023260 RepID=UPI0040285F95
CGAASHGHVASGSPFQIFSGAVAGFFTMFGLSQTAAACIMTMCVSALALTTLDAVGRIGRMSFQELFSVDEGQEMNTIQKICVNKYFATVITLFFGFLLCLGGYMNIWPLFGSANQLLSAMVLICLTVFLKTTGRKSFMLYVPMVVMFCVTMTALVESAYALIIKIASGNWSLLIEGLQFVLAIALMVLAISIVYHCGKELVHADNKTAHHDAQPTATH